MDRRSFVGSVLGLLAGSQVPFKVKEVDYVREDSTKLTVVKAYVRTFEIPESKLLKYKVYLITSNAIKFWAPPIESVKRDHKNLKCIFKIQPLEVKQELTYKAIVLVTDCGITLGETSFGTYVNLLPGDTLKATYTLSMGW